MLTQRNKMTISDPKCPSSGLYQDTYWSVTTQWRNTTLVTQPGWYMQLNDATIKKWQSVSWEGMRVVYHRNTYLQFARKCSHESPLLRWEPTKAYVYRRNRPNGLISVVWLWDDKIIVFMRLIMVMGPCVTELVSRLQQRFVQLLSIICIK